MKTMLKLGAAAVLGAALLGATATSASAEIVCNHDGDCWHVKEHYKYHPDFDLVVHPDNWHWRHDAHYRWHEHQGRGYWHGGTWVTF